MSKASFEQPVVFMLRPNLLQRVGNIAEASYFLLHCWPQERGPAYLAARDACYLAALGQMSADDCRRAFARALPEAGMPSLDEFGNSNCACADGDRPEPESGYVWFPADTKASAVPARREELSSNLTMSEVGKALRRMRERHGGNPPSL
ncbi:hypothetical protein GCM10007874_35920 [Labrys miyagiensis]|uniref:DUF982 domain-containing protein n=1 Tax=Labrys miyagiensis TaxID=346912 RepID=A0ABQ6CNS6_9HYPH|nr:DUF982 domain-containing protein [Labrys miyagiensis]GLS20575.1 hypothetical protein GCM10007874_35920 [Labrys miyagiensis]